MKICIVSIQRFWTTIKQSRFTYTHTVTGAHCDTHAYLWLAYKMENIVNDNVDILQVEPVSVSLGAGLLNPLLELLEGHPGH